jgi:hypothetical protein
LPKSDFSCPYQKNQVTKPDGSFCAVIWTKRQKRGLVFSIVESQIKKISHHESTKKTKHERKKYVFRAFEISCFRGYIQIYTALHNNIPKKGCAA